MGVYVCCVLVPWPPFQLSRKFYHLRFSFTWVSFHIKRSRNEKQNYALLLPLPLARLFEGFSRPACYKVKTERVGEGRGGHTQTALKFWLKMKIRLNFVAIFSSCSCINDVHVISPFITCSLSASVAVSLTPSPPTLSLKRALAIYYFNVQQSILCIILFIYVIRILMRQ